MLCYNDYTGLQNVRAFIRYASARFKTEKRGEAYRFYITDGIYVVSEHLHALAGGGPKLTSRFADLIDPEPEKPQDTRTQEEIVSQVWRSIRGD